MKLGSLFDGSGGFPLAGTLFGIEPVWASEIEPFPIRVTKLRFPNMRHLGSVTEVNGTEVEPVDIITFGSPCQDLSVAGKQAGIHEGERSNLFFEAIRIIKEMRHATATQFPRFAVWENVPGAFSSNKGEDFRAVLQALCEISDPGVHVPEPPRGGWKHAGCIVGDGYSVAWRLYDAQFWGVPQRRKRIYLVADFGSERAGEILFERESVSGDPEPGGTARQGTAADAEGSVAGDDCAVCYALKGNAVDRDTKQNGRPFGEGSMYTLDATDRHAVAYGCDLYNGGVSGDKAVPLCANTGASANHAGPTVMQVKDSAAGADQSEVIPINTMVATRWNADDMRTTFGIGKPGDPQFTIGAAHEHAVCFQQNQRDEVRDLGEHSGTVIAQAGARNKNYVCFAPRQNFCGVFDKSTVSETLQTRYHYGSGGDGALVVHDARGNGGGQTAPTLTGDHQNRVTDYTCICVERKHHE